MQALSIRQPWAWLIVNGFKDIENRSWPTKVRGRFLIHAASAMTREEWLSAVQFAHYRCGVTKAALQAGCEFDQLMRGGIVGQAEIVDCVEQSESRWFVGPQGFLVAKASPTPFVQMRGRLGFFGVSEEICRLAGAA